MTVKVRFYHWARWTTCKKAGAALTQAGVELESRDFFKDPLSREELEELAGVLTIDELFSWRSPSAKKYRDQRGQLSDSALIDLMLDEPRLIRRPISIRMDDSTRHALGNKQSDIDAISIDWRPSLRRNNAPPRLKTSIIHLYKV